MRRKRTSKTVELTVERSEFFAAAKSREPTLFRCAPCGGPAPFVTPAEAARASGESLREVFRRIEAAEIHFFETPNGALLVCLESLNQNR
jgi:hypothetical protein